MIVYFSSASNYTHRFVEKLDLPATRIPLNGEPVTISYPFVLLTPTYGAGGKGYVPKQVIKFLNIVENRTNIRGVIASGNTNFGEDFCKAGKIISSKCSVPLLYCFELMGLIEDVEKVQEGLKLFWEQPLPATMN
jgi:protein involved in ribonucleotide reduction